MLLFKRSVKSVFLYESGRRRPVPIDNSAASHWGVDWFILPNPLYGEWEKLLGDQPKLKLRATAMKLFGR